MGGTRKNRTFRWEDTPEAARRKVLMGLVRSRDGDAPQTSPGCCAANGYRVCAGPRGSPKHESTTLKWKLHSWEISYPGGARRRGARRAFYAKAPRCPRSARQSLFRCSCTLVTLRPLPAGTARLRTIPPLHPPTHPPDLLPGPKLALPALLAPRPGGLTQAAAAFRGRARIQRDARRRLA